MQSYFEIYKTNLVLLIFHIAFQVLLYAVGILLFWMVIFCIGGSISGHFCIGGSKRETLLYRGVLKMVLLIFHIAFQVLLYAVGILLVVFGDFKKIEGVKKLQKNKKNFLNKSCIIPRYMLCSNLIIVHAILKVWKLFLWFFHNTFWGHILANFYQNRNIFTRRNHKNHHRKTYNGLKCSYWWVIH